MTASFQSAPGPFSGHERVKLVQDGYQVDLPFSDAAAQAARASGLDASMFEAIAFNGLTAPAEYIDFVAMIDRETGAGDGIVARATIGTASDGATPIYSWTAGAGAKTALWLGGQHSVEPVGQLALIRAFQWFARSAHPLARRLRASYRVILIANANPWAFKQANGGRLNFNGVNLNRNWDFFWANYNAGGDATNFKGTSAASESETQAIMALFDTNDIQFVVDCHNKGANAQVSDLAVGPPSMWVRSNRTMVDGAMAAWKAATGGTVEQQGVDFDGEPQFLNWANWKMTVNKGVRNAFAALIESNSNLQGGTERVLTDAGANRYCNMVISMMREHLENGHRSDPARPYETWMRRNNPDSGTSIATGGTRVDVNAATPIQFDAVRNVNLAGTKRSFILLPAPCLGHFAISISGYLESQGTQAQRIDFNLFVNDVNQGSYATSQTISGTTGDRQLIAGDWEYIVPAVPDAKTLIKIACYAFRGGTISSTPGTPHLIRFEMRVRFVPDDGTAPIPVVPLP